MKFKSILSWELPIPVSGKRLSIASLWMMAVVVLEGVSRVVKTEAVVATTAVANTCVPSLISVYSAEVYQNPPMLDYCLPEEEIETDPNYRIIKNVRFLRDAKVIVYPENHVDIDGYKLQKRAIDILSSAQPKLQHAVLAEGIPRGITFQCDHYMRCIYPEHHGLPAKGFHVLIEPGSEYAQFDERTQERILCGNVHNTQTPKAITFYAHRIDKKFHCAGLDDPDFDTQQGIRRADELSEKADALKELNIYLSELGFFLQKAASVGGVFSKEKLIPLLNKIQAFLEKKANQLPKELKAKEIKKMLQNREDVVLKPDGVNFLLDQLGIFGKRVNEELKKFERNALKEIGVAKRNKFMISAINDLKDTQKISGQIHVPVGRKHVFPAGSDQHQYTLSKIKADEQPYGFAQYLQTVSHAIILTNMF